MNNNNIKAKYVGNPLGANTFANPYAPASAKYVTPEPSSVTSSRTPLTEEDISVAAMSIENALQDLVDSVEESEGEEIDLTKSAESIVKMLINNYFIPNHAQDDYEQRINSLKDQINSLQTQLMEYQVKEKSSYSRNVRKSNMHHGYNSKKDLA
jgi:Na+/phosphate symporter